MQHRETSLTSGKECYAWNAFLCYHKRELQMDRFLDTCAVEPTLSMLRFLYHCGFVLGLLDAY